MSSYCTPVTDRRVYLAGADDPAQAFAEIDRNAQVALPGWMDADAGEFDGLTAEQLAATLLQEALEELAVIAAADVVVSAGELDEVTAAIAAGCGKPVIRYAP